MPAITRASTQRSPRAQAAQLVAWAAASAAASAAMAARVSARPVEHGEADGPPQRHAGHSARCAMAAAMRSAAGSSFIAMPPHLRGWRPRMASGVPQLCLRLVHRAGGGAAAGAARGSAYLALVRGHPDASDQPQASLSPASASPTGLPTCYLTRVGGSRAREEVA